MEEGQDVVPCHDSWFPNTAGASHIAHDFGAHQHLCDRIPSTTPGAEPPRGTKDSGSARSHSTHLETSSQKRP